MIAADVSNFTQLRNLAQVASEVPGIGGMKLGFSMGLRDLAKVAYIVREYVAPDFPLIYDAQKAGTDIPATGVEFAKVMKESGINAVILFPLAGPATQEAWTKACFDAGLQVLVGGVMTHPQFLVSEGGYIADESVERIYRNACHSNVEHFVVPGTKLPWVKKVRSIVTEELGEGNSVLYAPGFITQGGDISECGNAAGDEWHAIVGSAIYGQPTLEKQKEAARTAASKIVLETT